MPTLVVITFKREAKGTIGNQKNYPKLGRMAHPDPGVLGWASTVLGSEVTVVPSLRLGGSPGLLRTGDGNAVLRVTAAELRSAEFAGLPDFFAWPLPRPIQGCQRISCGSCHTAR
jgi:hypothetical protein